MKGWKLALALAGVVLAAGIAAVLVWRTGPAPEGGPADAGGTALPAAVPYEFMWPEGAVRGTDVPGAILIPGTGQTLPLTWLGDVTSGPGEDKVAFLQRVRAEMVAYSDRQTFEACAQICSDGNGAWSVRMTTVSAVAHCAVPPICMRGHGPIRQTIHSHCPSHTRLRATMADQILSGGAMRHNRFFGRCDPDSFSRTDFEGWQPGWLAGVKALYRQEGPRRVTRFD